MGYYTKGEQDFFERTFEILEQYDNIKSKKNYNITLLTNCLLGTLIVANNNWADSLKRIGIDKIKDNYDILIKRTDLVKNMGDLIKALRNGICHWNQKNIKKDNGDDIIGIIFKENKEDSTISEIHIEGTLNYKHAVTIKFKNRLELLNFLKLLKKYILCK